MSLVVVSYHCLEFEKHEVYKIHTINQETKEIVIILYQKIICLGTNMFESTHKTLGVLKSENNYNKFGKILAFFKNKISDFCLEKRFKSITLENFEDI
uniref:Uncharacterized protein n=1 Tax=Strongyloides venezuelensis TaxID=75913 RepID=A0A0K0G573_STRVS